MQEALTRFIAVAAGALVIGALGVGIVGGLITFLDLFAPRYGVVVALLAFFVAAAFVAGVLAALFGGPISEQESKPE